MPETKRKVKRSTKLSQTPQSSEEPYLPNGATYYSRGHSEGPKREKKSLRNEEHK